MVGIEISNASCCIPKNFDKKHLRTLKENGNGLYFKSILSMMICFLVPSGHIL